MDTKRFAQEVRDILKRDDEDPSLVSTLSDYEIGLWRGQTARFLDEPGTTVREVPREEFDSQELDAILLLAEKVEREVFHRAAERPPFTRNDFETSIVQALLGGAERAADTYRKTVAGNHRRMNEAEFTEYYKSERAKLLEHEILPEYDDVREEFGSLENHISKKAEKLEARLRAPINWKAVRFNKQALWSSKIIAWREGLIVEAKLAVLDQFQTPSSLPLHLAFLNLFVNENAAHRALNAAIAAGIIDETGEKKLGKKVIIQAIMQFWEAVSDRKFELTHQRAEKEAIGETYQRQCEAVAKQFGATIGKSAIYDRAGERSGKYFTAVARALGGT